MGSMAGHRFWGFALAGLLGLGKAAFGANLDLAVDDDAGRPIAFRVHVSQAGRMVTQVWERGHARLSLPAGKYILQATHGFDHDAVRMEVDLGPQGGQQHIALKRRYDVRSLGWFCGESHLHGQHGHADKPQTFADAARLAEANGLDYIQIAQWWTPEFDWTLLEKLEAMGREVSTPQVVVRWNLESPKCYFTKDDGGEQGNLHCYGHGCTLNLQERPYGKDFWFTVSAPHKHS